jgi:Uma2 family endonuclease
MAVVQRIDPATYERLAVDRAYRFVELRDGVLVEKPPVSVGHAYTIDLLARDLSLQLDPRAFLVSANNARLRVGDAYLIPDLVVLPVELARAMLDRNPHQLAVYDAPMPLVVEVWSPSTGRYDIATKIPLYQARGDRELWFVRPVERTVTAWFRRDDGGYDEATHQGGVVACAALPGVRIDLSALFA